MLIGYARVSTRHQNLARQIAALTGAGCKTIFTEKLSGKTTRNRPQLARALARLGKGDVFVVAEWDRATRSMMDGLGLMTTIHARGATIRVLDRASLDLTTPTGRAVLGLLSAIFEEERVRIVRRAQEGLQYAKRNGVKLGRKPKLAAADARHALGLVCEGRSFRRVGIALGVSHHTISKLVERSTDSEAA